MAATYSVVKNKSLEKITKKWKLSADFSAGFLSLADVIASLLASQSLNYLFPKVININAQSSLGSN